MWKRGTLILVCAALVASLHAANSKNSDLTDALFRDSAVCRLQIEIPPASLAALTESSHSYVRATVREGETTWRDVGVRLKGHATFQPIDKKPGLTLKFNEFVSGQEFHGLTKVMLNNCAQDPSYLREPLAAQLFRDAGLPAPHIAHARVKLNDREMGFYVLAEGLNKGFLKREFKSASGNLYEGETRDIDEKLNQENGDDLSQSDLKALADAARRPAAERMQKLRALLDVDEFTTFLAMEMITASIDGYAFKKNNYRMYHHPKTDRLVFMPHGLDATFGSAGFQPPQDSVLVKALWELPEFQKQYRAKLAEFSASVWKVTLLNSRLNSTAAKLIAAAPDRATAQQIDEEAKKLRYQIAQQQQLLTTEIKRWEKK
jgi:spore coat protein CotH